MREENYFEKKNKYGYNGKNNCKTKKELRAWIRQENIRRKAEV